MASDRPGALDTLSAVLGLHPVLAPGNRPPADGPTETALLGLVGSLDAPRFLVPVDHPDATCAALSAYNRLRPLRTRLNRRVVAATATTPGLSKRVVSMRFTVDRGPGSLVEHLGQTLGVEDLQVAVGVGNFDAVWKPTLQCFTPDGEPVAYVKVGVGPVGAHLVARERPVLEAWTEHDDPRLVVPRLLAVGSWRDHPLVACEPMPLDARRLPPGDVSAWPVRQMDPPLADRPLLDASWWTDRRRDFGDDGDIAALMDGVEAVHGGRERAWARWHGDWVPWNLARSGRGLVAWDWEYSEPGAPAGLDELHCIYQVARHRRGGQVQDALGLVRASAEDQWLADAHLVMLSTRHRLLERLTGRPVGDHHQVMAAVAERAIAVGHGRR
ncbi:MAG: hypothetical protein H6519_00080 [Microthrixaceae bacterium]|nr:hypothetical protein [Acidimicrobiales bacterium]MCB9402811.1 hypothetical protein [Microthrixaceae bacterium]